MIEYLIVGSGIAGLCFAEVALQNSKSFLVFDDNSQNSSRVAACIYNPVILKRFSQVWKANEQITLLNEFYPQMERRLGVQLDHKIPVIRKLFSVEEQNNWFTASDKPNLGTFLAPKLLFTNYSGLDASFGFGEVLETGYVNTKVLVESYHKYLIKEQLLIRETFDYTAIGFHEDCIEYKGIKAKHIIFAEGFGLLSNPYFNYLPLDGTKGELLIIKSPNLSLDSILNSSMFIMPLGNDLFKVGATYNWDDKTSTPTEEGKKELVARIKEIINCDFEIIEHFAGVRPTVNDRRPLVGTHHIHKRLHVLNGLGTRGVMLGPFLAKQLLENIEFGKELDKEIDIIRFSKKIKNV